MIITRSPLRITLGGGGTDLPSYYRRFGGFLISAAIDKYVYVTITRPFTPGIFLKYSKLEHVEHPDEVQHPIIREALKLTENGSSQIEITTLADIPAGTGLGSSGSFTTALLRALSAYHRKPLHSDRLAALACDIEIDRLNEPIGKQDQYIAAYGGVTCFTFHEDDGVEVRPVALSQHALHRLEDHLLLFFTGYSRSASSILAEQKARTTADDREMVENLHYVKELGKRSLTALEAGDLTTFGEMMHEHWVRKRERSGGMTNSRIDEWYQLALKNGARGGKLVGAGGGGFLMFYADDAPKLRNAMRNAGLDEVRFRFDFEGTKVLFA